ncbi:MAG TPA: cupredoxin family copper-binding protein [Candidatus Polarisedimenticolia bacterium]|jgi:plastocyanin|nr:cupredoxin family copper-binding protein [Candidatus Polarisedimenticolia bacterium]
MKRTVSTLGFAALAIVILMVAGRSRIFGVALEDKPTAQVKIDNFVFSPNPLTVPAGSTIRWTNQDDIPHNVVSDDKSFKSKVLDTDETFTYTFTKPGTYTYFCSIHPKMTGKVVVQ